MTNVHNSDCLDVRKFYPTGTFQTCITSPLYFNNVEYTGGVTGRKKSIAIYITELCNRLDAVRTVMRADATLWLNIADSYDDGFPLCIPDYLKCELVERGWWFIQDIIWSKPNPRPESVTRRFTQSHEHIFLFGVQSTYLFNQVKEPAKYAGTKRGASGTIPAKVYDFSNKRSVWEIQVNNTGIDHPAPFPEALVEPCMMAGSKLGSSVIDPFCGSGTTGIVAKRHGRHFAGFDISEQYVALAKQRIEAEQTFDMMNYIASISATLTDSQRAELLASL